MAKDYSVSVGRTTVCNVQPEDQEHYFLVEEGSLGKGWTVIASVHVSPRKSHETFEHIKIGISIPTDQPFVSPGVLLDTAFAAIAAREDAYYGVSLVDSSLGMKVLELLPKHRNMNTVKQEDRTPERLLLVLKGNKENAFITNILKSAEVLCALGYRDSTYLSQYIGGMTLWEFAGTILIVHPNGNIEHEIDRSSGYKKDEEEESTE